MPDEPSSPTAGPPTQWLEDLPPHLNWLLSRLLLTTVLLGLATPVEVLAPLLRTVRGRRGVQCGPPIASLATALAGLALASRAQRRPGSRLDDDRWFAALLGAGIVLPAAAATVPATVVLRGRSPLWAWVASVAGRVAAAGVLSVGAGRVEAHGLPTRPGRPPRDRVDMSIRRLLDWAG